MLEKVKNRIALAAGDPVPPVLTVLGCILSGLALIYGLAADVGGFLLNVAASLVLVGPALAISNIAVRAVQDSRARANVEPLVLQINDLLGEAFETGEQAFSAIGYKRQRGSYQPLRDQLNLEALSEALIAMTTDLEKAIASVEPFLVVRDIHPISVPRFSLIRKVIYQADRHYPLPSSATAAVIADDWADTCGIDFSYAHDSPNGGIKERVVGVAEIRQKSQSVNPSTTGVSARNYLDFVQGSLHYAAYIAVSMAREVPRGVGLPS